MRINRLIKCSLISILSVSFVLINNINLTFACGSPAMAKVYIKLDEISKKMKIPPLCFICLLYGGCYNDMKTIEKYTKDIEKNLNNLRDKIGNVEFNNLWNNSIAFEEETEEEIEKGTIGKKLQELLGLTRATLASEVVHKKSTGVVLDMYKKMLASANIPTEDEDVYNKPRERLEEEKVKELLKKEVMPLLDQAQGEVFTNLDKLDEETKKQIKDIKEFHEVEIEEHKKASRIQAICKSRIDLVGENLSNLLRNLAKLLRDVEQNLDTLKSITPDNLTNSVKCVICFSKIKQAIMNMSYITMPDYLDRSLERRVQLRTKEPEERSVAEIIKFQRKIGDLQTEVSFLREPIIQLTIEPTIFVFVKKYEQQDKKKETSLSSLNSFTKENSKSKKSEPADIEQYMPWQNSELAVGIAEKLNTYSLNQYHFLQKGASAGMDKAHEIWTSLGYINEDSGFFEARIRQALVKSQIYSVTGRQNVKKDIKAQKDKYYGDTYAVVIKIPGIDLEKQTLLTSWEYKKIDTETTDDTILLSYPRCVTIYQKE